jgi:GR25 family glycosyltransferase involved in LPS biosynthesis
LFLALNALRVVIISTPESERSRVLESTLSGDLRFRLISLNATVANTYRELEELNLEYSQSKFKIFENRLMRPKEIACAYSHNLARKLIKDSNIGGLILEDDARLLDTDKLFEIVSQFLKVKYNTSSILNLTGLNDFKLTSSKKSSFKKIYSVPNLAVGYALTPLAAGELLASNNPVTYVSDWPNSKVKFYIPSINIVVHGDDKTKSYILGNQKDYRIGTSVGYKLKLIFFAPYIMGGFRFTSFLEYTKRVYLDRLFWHLERVRLKVLGYKIHE